MRACRGATHQVPSVGIADWGSSIRIESIGPGLLAKILRDCEIILAWELLADRLPIDDPDGRMEATARRVNPKLEHRFVVVGTACYRDFRSSG
jgi:hypothetical protein